MARLRKLGTPKRAPPRTPAGPTPPTAPPRRPMSPAAPKPPRPSISTDDHRLIVAPTPGPPTAGSATLPPGAAKIPRSLVDINAGVYGVPAQTPAVLQGPPEAPLDPETAIVTLGIPLRYNRAYSLFIDDPLFQELRGPRADRTMQRMLADPIIAGTVERTSLFLRAADWDVKPASDAPLDVAWSTFVNDNFQNLTGGWRSTVAHMADAIAWGFSLHEVLFEVTGNAVMWADFSPREQRTVRSWYVDPGTGRLKSVVQITDRGLSLPIPAWKLLHFRTHPASGRPEGRSLVRNAFLPWTDKQELRRITKLGLRRDFTGVAVMEVPPKILSKGATATESAALTQAEALVRDFERDEREGIIMPSSKNLDGTESGWKFALVQSAGRRAIDLEAMFASLNRDILIALLSEYILLGHERVGSMALASVKTNLFGRAVTSWLDMIEELLLHKALPVLQAFNPQFAGAQMPIITHGQIDEVPLDILGTFLQAVAAGGLITPDPQLEETLRKRADLPVPQTQQEL